MLSEVKHPLKNEYLFRAFFLETVLSNSFKPVEDPIEPLTHYDTLVYPSVAAHNTTKNLAILPDSVKKLTPYLFTDAIVTGYKSSDFEDEQIQVTLEVLR